MENSSEESLVISPSSALLPNDLLYRILSLLPLQTLIRFRCVCKLWRSLPFSLLFSDHLSPGLEQLLPGVHRWFFSFCLLSRKVNEHRTSTYKSTMYVFSIAYDREMLGSCGHCLPAEEEKEGNASVGVSAHATQKGYEILNSESPLMAHLETGVLDILASLNGLLLLSLRLEKSQDHEKSSLKLFVYNPISKDLRALPSTQWAIQKVAMVVSAIDGDNDLGYKIFALERHYRSGTTYLLYSFEVYDSKQAVKGWQFLSHVKANLSGTGDMHPGSETAIMGYVNSKAVCNGIGFLYWMPSLDKHTIQEGRHTQLLACDMHAGYFYRLPGLTCKSTFADMWSHPTGLYLACGVASEADPLLTCAVEIWELHQGKEEVNSDEDEYGTRRVPKGTKWHFIDRMPHEVWDALVHDGARRIACTIANSLVFLVAEGENEVMVVYNASNSMWKVLPCWDVLHKLFKGKDSQYHQVFPWIIPFMPSSSSLA